MFAYTHVSTFTRVSYLCICRSALLVVAQATRDSFYDVEQFPHPLPPYAPHPADYDATIAPSSLVWPPPRSMSVTGSPLPLHESFTITTLVEGEAGLSEGMNGRWLFHVKTVKLPPPPRPPTHPTPHTLICCSFFHATYGNYTDRTDNEHTRAHAQPKNYISK